MVLIVSVFQDDVWSISHNQSFILFLFCCFVDTEVPSAGTFSNITVFLFVLLWFLHTFSSTLPPVTQPFVCHTPNT